MERLTNKKEADAQRREYENRLKNGYPRNIPEERFLKLAAYEDAMPLERVQELAQAEKGGRLVVLPCKPGTPIWEIGDFDGGNLKKRPFSVEDMPYWRFGITVFLTREEAEAALKKMEKADNETD